MFIYDVFQLRLIQRHDQARLLESARIVDAVFLTNASNEIFRSPKSSSQFGKFDNLKPEIDTIGSKFKDCSYNKRPMIERGSDESPIELAK